MREIYAIHPKDRTTDALSVLYGDSEHVIRDPDAFGSEIDHFLNHVPKDAYLMLLGHGSPDGLYTRLDDSGEPVMFDKVLVNRSHRFYLRQHNCHLIGIFCYAREFAEQFGLHGLFSGMFISEFKEALELGVPTTEEEVKKELVKFMERLRFCLEQDFPLYEIPDRLREMDDARTPLTHYNYYSIYYI